MAAPDSTSTKPEASVTPRPAPPTEDVSTGGLWGEVCAGDPELARLLALGEGALVRQDFSRAVDAFRKARRHAPGEALPIVGLVAARFGQLGIPTEYKGAPGNKDVRELLALLDEALKLKADSGAAHLERGRLLVVLGQEQPARGALGRARELLPKNAEAHSVLAVVDLAEGRVPEALEGFERASELDPNNPDRLANLGTVLLLHGDVQKAITTFRRAVTLSPNDARARGDLGTALLAVNDVSQALPHLQRAYELAPQKATFMSNLGYAHQRLGDVTAAEQWYNRALEADPKLGSAWINLGTLRASMGQYDAAEQAFRKALALDPEDPRALGNLEDLAQLRAGK